MTTVQATTRQIEPAIEEFRVAVLIPCRDEAAAIAGVIRDFRRALPAAEIYVYDNNSTDQTRYIASDSGATVCAECQQGKGHVVRRMFADVDADIYVLVDGDGTYDASYAPIMIDMLLAEQLDMVNGRRISQHQEAYRGGHRMGNRMLSGLVGHVFGKRIADVMSGYRVLSRRFVKTFPALSTGFETETELIIHALQLDLPMGEVDTPYRPRPEGSASKLRTYSDGVRILATILHFIKEEKPLLFFGVLALILLCLGVGLSVPIFMEYSRTGLVPRFPTAILSTGIVLLAFLSLACGLILDSIALGRIEAKRLAYLMEGRPVAGQRSQGLR